MTILLMLISVRSGKYQLKMEKTTTKKKIIMTFITYGWLLEPKKKLF